MQILKLLVIFTALSLITHSGFSQRNIIDVPTSEIVEPQHLFFQEQVNISHQQLKNSTILTYGLSHSFEVGFMLNQLTFNTESHKKLITIDPEKPEENPDFFITGQKGFDINDWLTLGLGTRLGISAAKSLSSTSFVNFSFLNAQFSIPESETKFNAGVYYGNDVYVGEGNNAGFMLGTQITILRNKLHLIADYTSGKNITSVMNIGPQISLGKTCQLAIAAQLPSPESDNDYGFIIQLATQ